MQPIDLKVKVTLRPLLTIGKQHRFELTQLIMFSDIGSFKPLDVKTVIIYHPPHITSVSNKLDEGRPQISFPYPYHHSPNIYSLDPEPQGPQLPTYKIVGNLEYLFLGASNNYYHQSIQITSKLLKFKPQISYVATQYLCMLHESEYSHWFDEHLLAIIYNNAFPEVTTTKGIFSPVAILPVPT